MKNKLIKLISSLLVAALLVSMTTVFAFAAEDDGTANDGGVTVLLNRTFEEGWEYSNGLGAIADNAGITEGGQEAALVNETLLTGGINNFFEITTLRKASKQPYVQVSTSGYASTAGCGGMVLEFDINSRDGIDVATTCMYARLGGTTNAVNPDKTLLSFTADGYLSSNGLKLVELTKEWAHITICFDYSRFDEKIITATVSCDQTGKSVKIELSTAGTDIDPFPALFRIKGPDKNSEGNSVGYDNIKLYVGTDKVASIPSDDYGILVNPDAAKSYDTTGGAGASDGEVEKSVSL